SPTRWLGLHWTTNQTFGTNASNLWLNNINGKQPEGYEKRYDELLNYLALGGGRMRNFMIRGIPAASAAREEVAYVSVETAPNQAFEADESVVVGYGQQEKQASADSAGDGETETTAIPIRTNLQETAFFFPQLQTDADGNVTFKFTMPEA